MFYFLTLQNECMKFQVLILICSEALDIVCVCVCVCVCVEARTITIKDTYLLTYLLTPWSRVLLEKLTGSASSQEIPRIL